MRSLLLQRWQTVRVSLLLLLLCTQACFQAHAISQVSIAAKSVHTPQGKAQQSSIAVDLKQRNISLNWSKLEPTQKLNVPEGLFGNGQLQCVSLSLSTEQLSCPNVFLQAGKQQWRGSAAFETASRQVILAMSPTHGASAASSINTTLTLDQQLSPTSVVVKSSNWTIAQLQALTGDVLKQALKSAQLASISGTLSTELRWSPGALELAVELRDAAFADATGLRAGEKLALDIKVRNQGEKIAADIEWQAGDIFFDPVLLSANAQSKHRLSTQLEIAGDKVIVEKGSLVLGEIGKVDFRAHANLKTNDIGWFSIDAKGLSMAGMMQRLVKPMAASSIFGEIDAAGSADLALQGFYGTDKLTGKRRAELANVHLTLNDVNVTDPRQRFGLTRLDADIPWVRGEFTGAQISWDAAMFGKLPLGAAKLPIALSPDAIELRKIKIPIADGALEIDRLAMDRSDQGAWPASISGRLTPISMALVSTALGWPEMKGTIAGELPGMVYYDQTLTVNGDLHVKVFDGELVAKGFSVSNILGRAPRLNVDVSVRRLDLEQLTGTFKFGKVQGRLDADLNRLELAAWQPTRGDIRFYSSEGDYRKRISQQAVENISALGGAGASAAIQRSVLRFFKEFSYTQLALGCQLRDGVCVMSGVNNRGIARAISRVSEEITKRANAQTGEYAKQDGSYVIVQGGGVPGISVLGYNRHVSLSELVSRVKAAIESNEKPRIEF